MSNRVTAGCASLPDGRRLAYLSIGPDDGALVLYLHGAIGSPQDARAELQAVTHDLGIRYVMVSRPGFDGSDPAPSRTLLSFARDAAALADHLGHERFAVVGVSAGGPYALACAHDLPDRVAAAAVVGCMAPGRLRGRGLAAGPSALRLLRSRPQTCTRPATRCSRSRAVTRGSSYRSCAPARR